jgi:hypothetical protein
MGNWRPYLSSFLCGVYCEESACKTTARLYVTAWHCRTQGALVSLWRHTDGYWATVFTGACHVSIPWVRWIQPAHHPVSLTSTLTLASHIHLRHPACFFPAWLDHPNQICEGYQLSSNSLYNILVSPLTSPLGPNILSILSPNILSLFFPSQEILLP